ncbi:MAG: transglutaminase-like domain-containing protein [Candidatus Micrarchaeota archaeon]|nr:transglutaminase-like domain-containing protein [Candidatus Micrarchaeota archaeon]
MNCNSCKRELEEDWQYCPKCGRKVHRNLLASVVFHLLVALAIAAVVFGAVLLYTIPRLADSLALAQDNCTLSAWEEVYAGKIHAGNAEVRDAAAGAINGFDGADGLEAAAFEGQLLENLRSGNIDSMEYANIKNAVAVYMYVRDEVEYSLGPPGAQAAQDDLTTLKRKIGKCDEKSVLLASMAESVGIGALLQPVSKENDVSQEYCGSDPCGCSEKFDHMRVALYLPGFRKMQVYDEKPHYSNATFCAYGDYVIVDPTCIKTSEADCPFAYGLQCYAPIFLNSTR